MTGCIEYRQYIQHNREGYKSSNIYEFASTKIGQPKNLIMLLQGETFKKNNNCFVDRESPNKYKTIDTPLIKLKLIISHHSETLLIT